MNLKAEWLPGPGSRRDADTVGRLGLFSVANISY